MDQQLKITEVSLSFDVQERPRTPVDSSAPFVIDTRGKDIERVVPAGIDAESLPEWIMSCKQGYLRFTYMSEPQNVECTFKESESTLTFHGIKHQNVDELHFGKVFDILGTEQLGMPKAVYKATMALDIGTPWSRDLVADVITNDPEISHMAAVSERLSTLGNRCLFSVSVTTAGKGYARVTLRQDDMDEKRATVTMSRLPDAEASAHVAGIVKRIFEAYRSRTSGITHNTSPSKGFTRLSGIRHLRSELPELFINNYTRECPVLPIMVSLEQARLLEGVQRVILYPINNSSMGRLYTAPEGHFVGLKKNRLANRDMFPCLVTCYLHDHMLRKGSETYRYYTGENVANRSRPSKPVPRSIGLTKESGYDRKRASSFINAIEIATNTAIDTGSLPWCPQVAKQEMWDVSDEDIMGMINSHGCRPSAYRYFEELLGVSIHAVIIKDGMLEPLVCPYHSKLYAQQTGGAFFGNKKREYIWAPPYPQHIIVFETIRRTYGEDRFLYDVLVKNSNVTIFNDDEPAVLSVVSQKSAEYLCPPDIDDAAEQLIDEEGKCRIIATSSGEQVVTFTRPFTAPVMPDPVCFFDSHITKMNALKSGMGLRTTDLYKRSTSSILYFPNDASFRYWVGNNTA